MILVEFAGVIIIVAVGLTGFILGRVYEQDKLDEDDRA